MKKSVLFLLIAASPLALASVDSIKNNYRKYALISDSFTNSSDKPGYQVATAPNVNWKPRLNLDNATGSPSIDLSNATGDIGNTGGVNQAVKNHVADEIAKIKPTTPTPPPTPTGWQTIYSGSGENSFVITGTFSSWRATVSYYTNYTNRTNTENYTGVFGSTLRFSHTVLKSSDKCDGEATAFISVSINNNINMPKSASATGSCYARAEISNAVITKLEIYR